MNSPFIPVGVSTHPVDLLLPPVATGRLETEGSDPASSEADACRLLAVSRELSFTGKSLRFSVSRGIAVSLRRDFPRHSF